ncbi:MAG: hypothetical protein ACRDRY_25260 [Pseudonocardiaceae bacterium]
MIRCKKCKRFTNNNIALRGFDAIKDAHGDCARHGPGVPVEFDAWEDWGWSDEDDRRFEEQLIASTVGWASLPHEVDMQWPASD